MRISDWSSDVCSSDLGARNRTIAAAHDHHLRPAGDQRPHFGVEIGGIADGDGVDQLNPGGGEKRLGLADHSPTLAAVRVDDQRCLARDGCACFRSEEHPSELQSIMRISYAVFCLNKNTTLT